MNGSYSKANDNYSFQICPDYKSVVKEMTRSQGGEI